MHLYRQTTYQAARAVAGKIEEHFTRQLAAANELSLEALATAPSVQVIEAILDTAFWASLRREEGQTPKISLAYLPPDQVQQPLLFEHRLPLSPEALIKIAPGVERAGIHLGVWLDNGVPYVWGTTRSIPSYCFVVDVSEPGLLVIKHRRADGFGKFANVAVLKGDQVKVINEGSARLPDCPDLLTSLLGFSSPAATDASTNVLIQLAVSMRAHKRGGALLVVPAGSAAWRKSIVHPITYSLHPPFRSLKNLIEEDVGKRNSGTWQDELRREIASVAGLTAVDGATVLSDTYDLLAFGVKIGRAEGCAPVERLLSTEPIVGGKPAVIHPSHNGGTRHLSAAQFIHDQRDAMALVASQDGRFTVFAWSPCEDMVQAHRIDTLLL